MGCTNDRYEPPKENKINIYLNQKKKIINAHISNATTPTDSEIQLISKMDIDISEFLTRNINLYQKKIDKYKNPVTLKKLKIKLDYFLSKKKNFDNLNWQWEGLLGYHDDLKNLEEENKEKIKENIINNNLRNNIFEKKKEKHEEEEEEEEDDEDEIDSKDFYCNSPFYEQNPNIFGNEDKFHSYIESIKNEEDIIKEKYPFDF